MLKIFTLASAALMIVAGAAQAQIAVDSNVTNYAENSDVQVDVTVTVTPRQEVQPVFTGFGRYCQTQVSLDLLPASLPLGSPCTPRIGHLYLYDGFGNVITGFVR